MSDEKVRIQGKKAEQLLQRVDPYFEQVRLNLFDAFLTVSSQDIDQLTTIRMQAAAVDVVRELLAIEIANGQAETHLGKHDDEDY